MWYVLVHLYTHNMTIVCAHFQTFRLRRVSYIHTYIVMLLKTLFSNTKQKVTPPKRNGNKLCNHSLFNGSWLFSIDFWK